MVSIFVGGGTHAGQRWGFARARALVEGEVSKVRYMAGTALT